MEILVAKNGVNKTVRLCGGYHEKVEGITKKLKNLSVVESIENKGKNLDPRSNFFFKKKRRGYQRSFFWYLPVRFLLYLKVVLRFFSFFADWEENE